MTPEKDNKPLHEEDLLKHAADCSKTRRNDTHWVIGILVAVIVALAVPIGSATVAKYETDTRQDEQIRALQESDRLLRADLAEIKTDLKYLVQWVREKAGE